MTQKLGFKRLHNAELIEFLSQILQVAAEAGPLPAKVAETASTLRACVDGLEALHKSDPSSLVTRELIDLDGERDDLFTGLLTFCRSFSWHNDAALKQYSAALLHCIDNYGTAADITRKPYAEESATIHSLLDDLARPELQDAISRTGAALWIAPLKAVNDRFRERFLARNEEGARKELAFTMIQKRTETAGAYDSFLRTLDAARIMGEQGLDDLSRKISTLTDTQRRVLAQRAGRAEAAATPPAASA
ncbi:DUF6261 family protein [Flaviaesturariibacter terrae]